MSQVSLQEPDARISLTQPALVVLQSGVATKQASSHALTHGRISDNVVFRCSVWGSDQAKPITANRNILTFDLLQRRIGIHPLAMVGAANGA